LAETGYVEDRNVSIEYRRAEDQYDRLPSLARELVQRPSTSSLPPAARWPLPAKAATEVIPTVFMIGSDPVELGLVAGLNRPGGNRTGVAYLNVEERCQASRSADLAADDVRFVLNLKAAKALGLSVPDKLLALADEVIE